MSIYLEDKELGEFYAVAQEQARRYFTPFDEHERLAANKIRGDIPANYPRVNDGSLSALLFENPKRVFRDLFGGKFTSLDRDEAWLLEIMLILWTRRIIPNAKQDASFYVKFWNMCYRSQIHGRSSAFAFFKMYDGVPCVDFTVDYVRDVLPEPGKVSLEGSNAIPRNSYMTKLDLRRLIDSVKKEHEKAEAQKRDSYSTWDLPGLQKFYDDGPDGKDAQDKNLTEREKEVRATHFKMVTIYHRGFEAPFITFAPSQDGDDDSKVAILRRRKNENPTGDTPIVPMYWMQDLENPFGRSPIETAGPMQNVTDHFTQVDVLATQKGMDPPVDIHGTDRTGFKLNSIVNAPGARWYSGNMNIKTVETHNSIYTYLSERLGRYKGSTMNHLGAFDTSVSATSGDPQFSKTTAGVNKLDSRESVHDAFYSKGGRTAFAQLAKTLTNIYMANVQGQETFTLLKDEVERLRKAGWNIDGNRALLEYDKMRGKFEFECDSEEQATDPEKDALLEGIKVLSENETAIPAIEQTGKYRVELGEAYVQFFEKLHLSKLDRIIVPIDNTDETGDADGGVDPNATIDQATEDGTIPPTQPTPQSLNEDSIEQQTANISQHYQLSPEQAQVVYAALKSGHTADDLIAYIESGKAKVQV